MARVFLVVGISGVGKSTVIRRALKEMEKEIKWVNYGDLMLDVLREMGVKISRDELKFLPIRETINLQEKVVQRINEMPGEVILDTHLALESPYGYIPGVSSQAVANMNLAQVIIIEAPPEEIIKRRARDTGKRKRFHQTEEDIRRQLDVDRAMASSLAVLKGVPLKIIVNIDLDRAVKEFIDSLEAL